LTGQDYLHIGKVSSVFGIKGWLKIFSFTDDRESILDYSPWLLKKGSDSKSVEVVTGQLQGKTVIAQLRGIDDRNMAESLIGWDIYIPKAQLPQAAKGEYYWSDLIGLQVTNLEGIAFGKVTGLMETGANDVLLISGERERAVPFLQGQTVISIDLTAKTLQVDWDADF
jgi:16S rRNA processing protein RimM